MNRTLLLVCFFAMVISGIHAQDFSLKFGKVTQDELTMPSYPKDTTANAVVLYKTGDVFYEFNNGFRVQYSYENKIKILTQEGVEYANVSIPLYHEKGQNMNKEVILKLEAYAYNLENGKVVKTKMDKSYVFEERVSNYLKQVKFSIPAVKAGTVIEYRYKILSDFHQNLSDWTVQQSIPVVYAYYEAKIPEYFKFSIDTKGYERIKVEDTSENQSFTINLGGGQLETVQSSSRLLKLTSTDVPALKEESHVWCTDDFKSQVSFELHGTQFPNTTYKAYTKTWANIEETLKNFDSFGGCLGMRNPYRDEMKALQLDNMDTLEKIRTLFQFLKNKISWNDKYAFSGEEVKQAIKNGTGTNAEINFVLLSMFKDAGITAYPILLSRRTYGRLPLSYPSLNKINTFIVGAADTDSTMVYMDGSTVYGDVNILAPVLMVDRGRVYNPKGEGYWVDLTKVGKNSIRSANMATISPDGKITGKRQTTYGGAYASIYKKSYYQAKDSADFIEKIQSEDEIIIESCDQSGMEKFTPQVKEVLSFTKNLTVTDDHIYFNPMLFPHITKNSFTNEERKLPVEFPFPYELRLSSSIVIPEGYEVEEAPKNIKIGVENGGLSCLYGIQYNEKQIMVSYVFLFDKIIFSQMEYPTLKAFWEALVQKNTEQVVLRKKTAL